ncbi:hypothetical protein RH915_00510 [Serpentinicella sp. ANB-PHB4]|uniref:hypothetical protein n=1 Tax=Serpentinicella sp. ANB-PHB4 TaxID=3074076 RepID=UPI002858C772|nr:hypothetical protein [Serpentinicella sp. ANB-PHB4]MDR5657959.1 hypothetical protein [Serpentinicella sp. ANB-PHB4]
MIDSIFERRIKEPTCYKLSLEIPEKEYYNVYDEVTQDAAKEILNNFLQYHQDDGRPTDIDIKHSKNDHIVQINSKLDYLGNDHTKERDIPDYLNH